MYALLVGINKYASPDIRPLNGCTNDVDLMAELLIERFGLPPENLRVLKDSQATYAAIGGEFRKHLIDQAHAASERGAKDTAFLFHYSGHGSQAPDHTSSEPDGLDETIVSHDSRTGDIEDIKDWELATWLEELTTHCPNVTVIMDCCHSGSMTRSADAENDVTRRCPADTRPQKRRRPENLMTGRGIAGASGWRHGGNYALFAGCRDGEESKEHTGWFGRTLGKHGAMSYFLINQLGEMAPDHTLTYRELHRAVHQQVNTAYPAQNPCCEGDIDREVFGGLRPVSDDFIDVIAAGEGTVTIGAGTVHGITKDSVLLTYPPGSRTRRDASEPLASLLVVSVGPTRSECRIIEDEVEVPVKARAIVDQPAPAERRFRIGLDIASAPVRQALQQRLKQPDLGQLAKVLDNQTDDADFVIKATERTALICGADGAGLVAPLSLEPIDTLAATLIHLMRYKNVERLSAPLSMADAARIDLKLKQLDIVDGQPAARSFDIDQNSELVVTSGEPLVIAISNPSPIDLFFTVLNLTSDWAIDLVHPPQGAREILPAGKSFALGLSADPEEQLPPYLPDTVADEAYEIIKVIASSESTDFERLCQGNLSLSETSFDTLADLDKWMSDRVAVAQSRSAGTEVWATAQVKYKVRRN